MIVEDDVAIRELLRLHLSIAGFDITELGDGARALEVARSTRAWTASRCAGRFAATVRMRGLES